METESSDQNSQFKQVKLIGLIVLIIIVIMVAVLLLIHGHKKNVATVVSKHVASAVISIKTDGFIPSELVVKAGTVVTWTNDSDAPYQVSSNPYPSHKDLPGLYSKVLAPGATYSYTFTKVGTWGYDNFLQPTTSAEIIVKQ
jgi:plastocyanin